MNLSTKQKQTHRHRAQTFVFQREERWERDGLRVWDQQMQTSIYRMDKKNKFSPYSTENYIEYSVINHNKKEYEKECLYIYTMLH